MASVDELLKQDDSPDFKLGDSVKIHVQREHQQQWHFLKQGRIIGGITSHGAKVFDPKDKYDFISSAEWFPFRSKSVKMIKW